MRKDKGCAKCHYINLENYEFPCDECSRIKVDSDVDRWELSESIKYKKIGECFIKGLEEGFKINES